MRGTVLRIALDDKSCSGTNLKTQIICAKITPSIRFSKKGTWEPNNRANYDLLWSRFKNVFRVFPNVLTSEHS